MPPMRKKMRSFFFPIMHFKKIVEMSRTKSTFWDYNSQRVTAAPKCRAGSKLVMSLQTLERLSWKVWAFRRLHHTSSEEMASLVQTGMAANGPMQGACAQFTEDVHGRVLGPYKSIRGPHPLPCLSGQFRGWRDKFDLLFWKCNLVSECSTSSPSKHNDF